MKKALLLIAVFFAFAVTPFAAEAGDSDIVIISSLPVIENVGAKTIEKIYLKKKIMWENGEPIVAVNLPSDNLLRVIFARRILNRDLSSLVTYWNAQHFKGVSPPVVLESEEAVKKFVKEVRGSVGYITRKNLEPGLYVIYEAKTE